MWFQNGVFVQWLGNSALYSSGALFLNLLASIPAGYALALTQFRLRRQLLVVTLVVMMMPNTALVLPTFLELNSVGLIGSPLAVILPFSFFPFGVYLTYIHFATAVPKSLLAAARIDGCSELQVFTRIAVPMALPIIGLVGFFGFVQNWTNYFLPFVVLPSNNGYPIQVGLSLIGRSALPPRQCSPHCPSWLSSSASSVILCQVELRGHWPAHRIGLTSIHVTSYLR